MGRHSNPSDVWQPMYLGYLCERCGGSWAAVQVDEGVRPALLYCLATEHCGGPVVLLINPEGPPPDSVPLIFEWFKPKGNLSFRDNPLLNVHLANDGLLSRPLPLAPDWVKRRIGYFGGLRTF